jgi:hypothetical protein
MIWYYTYRDTICVQVQLELVIAIYLSDITIYRYFIFGTLRGKQSAYTIPVCNN